MTTVRPAPERRRPRLPTGPLRRFARPVRLGSFGATAADQAISSASNFVALLVVARAMSVAEFGVFSLGYAALTLALGAARAFFGAHVALQADATAARRAGAAAIGALLVVALPLAALTLLYVVLVAGPGGFRTAAVIALAAPIVCLQDVTRFIAVAAGRPRVALVSDTAWLVPVLLLYLLRVELAATQVLLLWAAAAALALLVAVAVLRPGVDLRSGIAVLVRPRAILGAQAVGALALAGSSLVMLSLVSLVADDAVLGALRSASVLFGPLNSLFALIPLAVAPLLYRNPRFGSIRWQLAMTGALVVVVAVYGTVVALLPASAGEALLGSVWSYARPIMAATIVEYGSAAGLFVAFVALATSLRAKRLALLSVVQGVLTIAVPVAAAALFQDALAVALGLAAAGWASFVIAILVQRERGAPPSRRPAADRLRPGAAADASTAGP